MEITWLSIGLSALALAIAIGFALTRRVEHNTARDTLITQLAANTAKSVSDAADAKVAAAEANAEIKLLTERFNTSQATNVGLVEEVKGLKLEVQALKEEVKMLNGLLTAEREENAKLKAAQL